MAQQNIKPILVTAAGGTVGGVSTFVVEMLRKEGYPVRAVVRRDDERAEAIRKLGAEVVVADLTVLDDIHRAISGCSRVYFSLPVVGPYLQGSLLNIAVAKHYGIEVFVNMSQLVTVLMNINHSLPSPQSIAHWLAEQALAWSGVPFVNVCPTVFLENPYYKHWVQESVKKNNELRIPFGKAIVDPIAAYDVARVVTAILKNPTPHLGKSYPLVGPNLQSMEEVAKEYSVGLGREIKYVPVDLDEFKNTVLKRTLEDEHTAKHLYEVAKLMQKTADGSGMASHEAAPVVEKITGQPAMGIAQWVRENADYFN